MRSSVQSLICYAVGHIYKITGLVCLTFIDLSVCTFDSPIREYLFPFNQQCWNVYEIFIYRDLYIYYFYVICMSIFCTCVLGATFKWTCVGVGVIFTNLL